MKIGIFGGTFNPPHAAHLITAEAVREEAGLDRILFVPSYISPHKQAGEETSAEDRLAMTRLAMDGNPFFECCEYEVEKGSVSYTHETLEHLCTVYPGAELFVIIGRDNFSTFHKWKHPERITDRAEIIVMNRPDAEPRWPEGIAAGRVRFVTVPNLEISSSDIRRRIGEGKSVAHMLPSSVEEYIRTHKLYVRQSYSHSSIQ